MPEPPPELREPFANDTQRQSAFIQLLQVDERLQALLAAAERLQRSGSMGVPIRDAIKRLPSRPEDNPENRLRRWITVFQDDADQVHDVRSRIIHGILTPDFDVKGSLWLGQYILNLIIGDASIAD
jgi:hypothetical protein